MTTYTQPSKLTTLLREKLGLTSADKLAAPMAVPNPERTSMDMLQELSCDLASALGVHPQEVLEGMVQRLGMRVGLALDAMGAARRAVADVERMKERAEGAVSDAVVHLDSVLGEGHPYSVL